MLHFCSISARITLAPLHSSRKTKTQAHTVTSCHTRDTFRARSHTSCHATSHYITLHYTTSHHTSPQHEAPEGTAQSTHEVVPQERLEFHAERPESRVLVQPQVGKANHALQEAVFALQRTFVEIQHLRHPRRKSRVETREAGAWVGKKGEGEEEGN